MLKENEVILKSRSDVVKKEEGTIESCVGTERDLCKIVILGMNVNIYHIVT